MKVDNWPSDLRCPRCKGVQRFYHGEWSSMKCQSCMAYVLRQEWMERVGIDPEEREPVQEVESSGDLLADCLKGIEQLAAILRAQNNPIAGKGEDLCARIRVAISCEEEK